MKWLKRRHSTNIKKVIQKVKELGNNLGIIEEILQTGNAAA